MGFVAKDATSGRARRKLILRSGLPPGDIVMLTAAVRDLHLCYPGQFLTDVRTLHPQLWQHNPHITPLSEDDPEVEELECSYPLIRESNRSAHHCLHGFIQFLNSKFGLAIRLTQVKGDIHLSALEKSWYSQVFEVTRKNLPFWIVSAGGKHDVTIKWWDTRRYQEVVDFFRDRIQFVQIGAYGHHHPRLEGVIDFRGQTDLRQLVRLVYHAQGVLGPITSLMHLAAAVETRNGSPACRPCVVIAGGREPAAWESYPGHQFIHLNHALRCCPAGGCWKNRAFRLRDGSKRDRPDSLCVDVIDRLPRCMAMIEPADVIRRIDFYFKGGAIKYLAPAQKAAARQGVIAASKNRFDQQPLNLRSAGLACDEFTASIEPYPGGYHGRGIVICGGGLKYFPSAWVCINILRRHDCKLPIQLWHLGATEMDAAMESLLRPLGVECVDARRLRRRFPARILNGWELKAYSILHSPFREVLLLDADNVPVVNPESLFDTPQFRADGAIFWPDYPAARTKRLAQIWRSCGLKQPREPEFESGQIVVDKERCWQAIRLSAWFNDNSDFYYRFIHGDKETFHLAFRKTGKKYSLVPTPIHRLNRTMCQHDFEGRRILQHRNGDKWDLFLCNQRIPDFWLEDECRDYVRELQQKWDGGLGRVAGKLPRPGGTRARRKSLRIAAVMITCPEREVVRRQTLANLAQTDWGDLPLEIQLDEGKGDDHAPRQTACAFTALSRALDRPWDYLLFLEDDLAFNRFIRHNLEHWEPLRNRQAHLGSLYNPGLRAIANDVRGRSRIVPAGIIYGSQALIVSRPALRHIVRHWGGVRGMQDIRISRLAGRLHDGTFFHAPSLVQHLGRESVSSLGFHHSIDYDPDWRVERT